MRGMEVATFGFLSKEQAERAVRAAITQIQPWPCQGTFAVCRHGWPRLCTLLSEAPPVLSRDQPMILSWFWRSRIGEQYSWASNMTMTTPVREKSLREPGPAETDNPCSIDRQLPLLPPGTLKLYKSWGEMTEHGGDCGSPGFRYKPWCAEILWKNCQILYSHSLTWQAHCGNNGSYQEFLREGETSNSQSQEINKQKNTKWFWSQQCNGVLPLQTASTATVSICIAQLPPDGPRPLLTPCLHPHHAVSSNTEAWTGAIVRTRCGK